MSHPWLADRTAKFDSSGIRKVFDLAAKLKNPINFSIGQPDFPVPEAIKEAAMAAIAGDRNGYSVTQGIGELRERLQSRVDAELKHADRRVLVTSGTSGALVLAILSMVNPGDEVIVFDPYFVMYPALVGMVGGVPVFVDTYPDFRIDPARVAAAITPRTKMILFNSPANPTGAVASAEEVRALAELAAKHNIALDQRRDLSRVLLRRAVRQPDRLERPDDRDRRLQQDVRRHRLAARLRARPGRDHRQDDHAAAVHVRLRAHPLQWAALAALDVDMSQHVADYKHRRDLVVGGLERRRLRSRQSGRGVLRLPEVAAAGTGSEFVRRAIANELLIIPGNVFSARDTHFRISYAASEATIERGLAVLGELNRKLMSRAIEFVCIHRVLRSRLFRIVDANLSRRRVSRMRSLGKHFETHYGEQHVQRRIVRLCLGQSAYAMRSPLSMT